MTSPNHLTLEQKYSFVQLVFERDSAFAEACRAFRISRQTGYKWLGRYRQAGLSGLAEQSRRPHHSPHATAAVWVERLRLARRRRKRWGRKSCAPGCTASTRAPAFLRRARWDGSCASTVGHAPRCGGGGGRIVRGQRSGERV